MPVLAVTALKQSPGATSSALGLAYVLSEIHPTVLIEADPRGGHLAVRTRLGLDPSTLSLVTASRRNVSDQLLEAHSHAFGADLRIVTGPLDERESIVAVEALAERASDLAASSVYIVVDCGRLSIRSAAAPLVRQADLVLCALFPTFESAEPARSDVEEHGIVDRCVLVTHGEYPSSAEDIATHVGISALAVPHDPDGVNGLYGAAPRSRSSKFVRAWRSHRDSTLLSVIGTQEGTVDVSEVSALPESVA